MAKLYPSLGPVLIWFSAALFFFDKFPRTSYTSDVSKNWWLALDLSSTRGTLALAEQLTVAAWGSPREFLVGEKQDHSENLLNVLQDALLACSVRLEKDVGALVTTSGPGSFTGLRIAFASFKALARSLEIPLWVVSGAEVRALDSADENPVVVTQVASKKWLREEFSRRSDGALLGLRKTKEAILDSPLAVSAPLSAARLLQHFALVCEKKCYASPQELATAAPNYFGSSFTSAGA